MIKDYSRRYAKGGAIRQNLPGRRGDAEGRMLKAIGLIVVSAMLVGVAASLWFGWKIRTDLNELARDSRIREQLTLVNRDLNSRRDELMTKENIEEAAAELGLYQPTARQIRRP